MKENKLRKMQKQYEKYLAGELKGDELRNFRVRCNELGINIRDWDQYYIKHATKKISLRNQIRLIFKIIPSAIEGLFITKSLNK
jgi:hypothetical protein